MINDWISASVDQYVGSGVGQCGAEVAPGSPVTVPPPSSLRPCKQEKSCVTTLSTQVSKSVCFSASVLSRSVLQCSVVQRLVWGSVVSAQCSVLTGWLEGLQGLQGLLLQGSSTPSYPASTTLTRVQPLGRGYSAQWSVYLAVASN